MPARESHPFEPYVPPGAKRLLLGSFPCPLREGEHTDYGDWFYSGSGRNLFWPLLSALTKMPVGNQSEKREVFSHLNLAIADILMEISRKKGGCADADLIVHTYHTEAIKTIIEHHEIRGLIFTSRFVQRQYERHLQGLIGHAEISQWVLPSPSPAANRAIGADPDYKAMKARGQVGNVHEYRLLRYREILTPEVDIAPQSSNPSE